MWHCEYSRELWYMGLCLFGLQWVMPCREWTCWLVGQVGVVSSRDSIAGRPFLCALCESFGVNGTIGLLKELEQNAEQWSSR